MAFVKRLDSPADDGELANYTGSHYSFDQLPRSLNASGDGVLYVDMGSLVNVPLTVTKGFNPYRIKKIYSGSSTALTVVGLLE